MDDAATSHFPEGFAFGLPPTPDAVFRLHALLRAPQALNGDAIMPTLTPYWQDIDMLDHLAHSAELPVTVMSVPAYAYVQDRYRILSCGARFGQGYGAMIITYNPLTPIQLPPASLAVAGLRNSGFLALSLLLLPHTFEYTLLPSNELREAVVRGEVEAALLTGEEQLTHQALGLYNMVDLGAWWNEQTQLPLPLEVIAVRRDVPEEIQCQIASLVRVSVMESLANREAALEAALPYARKLDRESTDSYIGMYVTEQSIEMGDEGKRSIETLLRHGAERGLIPAVPMLDILDASEDWQEG